MKAFPRDIEVRTMTVRHIGIENELAVEGKNEYDIQDPNRGNLPEKSMDKLSKHGIFQSIGHDGGGREFRTNPISLKAVYQVRMFLLDYFILFYLFLILFKRYYFIDFKLFKFEFF